MSAYVTARQVRVNSNISQEYRSLAMNSVPLLAYPLNELSVSLFIVIICTQIFASLGSPYRTWGTSNALQSYAGELRFESHPGHKLY
jgi:hypothetical protein